MKMQDQPRQLPSRAGQTWLIDGIRIFHRQPLVWVLSLMTYWAGLVMVGILPVVGLFLPLLFTPGLGFGFIVLAEAVERQDPAQPATPTLLLAGFRNGHARSMLQLGLAYLAGLTIVLVLAWLVDGDQITSMMRGGTPSQEEVEVMRKSLPMGLLVAMLAYIPLMMALWFAPQLVVWRGFTVGKALFFSFFAVWRNKAAFLRYSLAWLVLIFLVSGLSSLIMDLFSIGAQSLLVTLLPVSMLLLAIAQASFYASTRDVFREDEPLAATAPPPAPEG
jgi:hypothetical protein